MITVYGLANCDKTLALQKKLRAKNTAYTFIDFKTNPPSKQQVENWCNQKDWTLILNKRSTTWKSLSKSIQDSITTEAKAIELMVQYPTLIKRPVVVENEKLI